MVILVAVWLAVAQAKKNAVHKAFAKGDTLLIDVRTAEEFGAGHLLGAVNIPYDSIGEKIANVLPDKSAPIILYCRSGRRSAIALKTLQSLGYKSVINAGGYEALKNKYGSEKK
jgi:phage shock protein E